MWRYQGITRNSEIYESTIDHELEKTGHPRAITSISFLRASSFRASDLALLCTSKITAAPATYYIIFA
jgi:hypothetical protein